MWIDVQLKVGDRVKIKNGLWKNKTAKVKIVFDDGWVQLDFIGIPFSPEDLLQYY